MPSTIYFRGFEPDNSRLFERKLNWIPANFDLAQSFILII
jgi:hypothetical protein